jgi:hypothetical protein
LGFLVRRLGTTEDCPTLKEVYFSKGRFHHILDNNQEVEKVVRDMGKWVQGLQANNLTVFGTFTRSLKNIKFTFITKF